jgi:hypothetical protein
MVGDIMKSTVVAASLLTAMWLSSLPAFAQESEAAAAPATRHAVPRVRDAGASNPNRPEVRAPRERTESASARVPSSEADGNRSQPRREPVGPITQVAANAEQQGGVRRPRESGGGSSGGDNTGGAVRREPRGSGSGSGSSADSGKRSDYPVRGYAVPRTSSSRPSRPIYVYRPYARPWYYDPWYGYGGGFGIGYSYYSPWSWYGPSWYPYYGGGYYPYGGGYDYDIGRVRLKIKPRDAEVFVDGYYAGTVDDFDGNFQGLRLDSGAYKIEVRKPGFETLTYEVRVQPDRTITFSGELKPTQ